MKYLRLNLIQNFNQNNIKIDIFYIKKSIYYAQYRVSYNKSKTEDSYESAK